MLQKDAEGNIQSPIDNYEQQHRHGDHWTTDEARARYVSLNWCQYFSQSYHSLFCNKLFSFGCFLFCTGVDESASSNAADSGSDYACI